MSRSIASMSSWSTHPLSRASSEYFGFPQRVLLLLLSALSRRLAFCGLVLVRRDDDGGGGASKALEAATDVRLMLLRWEFSGA